uniref:Uncharacterized protein n=1 Tax=Accipiter nisus TaxID=211598 RepID=A0A8B9ND31_9AVES
MNSGYCSRHTSALRNRTAQAVTYSDAEAPSVPQDAASNLLSNIRSSWTNCTVLTTVRLPGAEEDREKIWDPSAMFSEDLWLENEKNCAVVHKSKRGRKRQELLAVALGVKVGVKGALLWQPLKLFAYSQITSLVRRAALTQNDNHFNYEKAHNFKVSTTSYSFQLKSSKQSTSY